MLERLMFWKKKEETKKADSRKAIDTELLEMDFLCQLSYMAAIATSGIDRGGLFSHAAKLPYLSAAYFKRVVFVAKAFNHDYSEACNIVGQATREVQIKELLLRFSGALSSGEDIIKFLERECEVFSETYGNSYERKLDSLAKWTDAYVALIMTTAIVTVMAVVTLMIGNATVGFIISLSVVTIIVTIAGAWFINKAAPKEPKTHSLPQRSREQDIARLVAQIILPAGVIFFLILLLSKADVGWMMVSTGAFLFPLGLVSKLDDIKISKRDSDIAGFLRSLGGVSQAIGATVNEAIGRLDFRALGSLANDVDLLFVRLLARIDPALCWNRFVSETGSEQVSRSVRIFWDAVALGGEPQRIGNHAGNFAMKIALLRAKRGMIGAGFLWLTMVMQVVLCSLLVFIYQTMITFTDLIQGMAPDMSGVQLASGLPTFAMFNTDTGELGLLFFMIVVIILVLTLSNSFSIYSISGGHIFNFAFYLSIALVIAGLAVVMIPPMVGILFNTII